MDLSWADAIKNKFPLVRVRERVPGEIEFTVSPDQVIDFLAHLKNLSGGGFDHLSDLTALDQHPKQPRFMVVYELISMQRKLRASVVSPVGPDNLMPTVVGLWAGANWLEREVYDMYGIRFSGHPDMRRILMPDVFQGHPLRKDFVVDYRQSFATPKGGGSGVFDPTRNTFLHDKDLHQVDNQEGS